MAGSQVRNTRIAMGVIVGAVVVAGALGLARPASPGPSPSPVVVAAHESPSPGQSKPPESPAPSAVPLAFEWHTSRVGADLSDLAVTGRGLIAVGWNQRGGIVWVSPDGEDWEIDDDSPTFDGVRLFAVGGNAHETVVVGCQLAGQTCGSGAAWVHGSGSTDRWRRVRGNPFGSASPDRVVATAERVMVRGIDGAGRPAFWVSNDGTRWTRVKSPVARTLEGNGGVLEVGASEKVFLMVGQDATGVDANGYVMGPAMVWTSADGAAWTASKLMDDAVARGVAALGDTIVVGGAKIDAQVGEQPVAWTSTNAATWSSAFLPVATDCVNGVDHVTAGPDGFLARGSCATYMIPAAGGPATAHISDGADRMIDGPHGFIGIGFHQFVTDAIAEVHPPLDPLADLETGAGWISAPSLPVAAPMTAAATAKGTIYVFSSVGDAGAVRVDRFDPSASKWTRRPDIDAAMRDGKAVLGTGGKIILVGVSLDGRLGRTVEYDPAHGTARALAGMPTARTSVGVAEYSGSVYVFGGRVSPCCDGVVGDGALDVVERFNERTGAWSRVGRMPVADAAPGAVAADIQVPIPIDPKASPQPTGTDTQEPQTQSKPVILVFLAAREWTFDPQAREWTAGPAGLSFGVTGSPILGVDGIVRVFSCTRYDLFDPAMGHWQPGQPFDVGRCGAIAVASDATVYVLGGDYLPSPGRSVSAFFAGGG